MTHNLTSRKPETTVAGEPGKLSFECQNIKKFSFSEIKTFFTAKLLLIIIIATIHKLQLSNRINSLYRVVTYIIGT